MKKAAIYARVSSREQAEEGASIPAQIKQLKQYAVEHSYNITHEFVDAGESARTANRPEFQNMIAFAKKKPRPFDVILIHKTDRFARNREDSIIYKSLLRKQCGIDVISITEKFDDSPQGKMLEGIMEVVAEFYSANLSREVMKGMNEQADHGLALGEPPYGYTISPENGKYAIYKPEARVIQYLFDEYINGGSLRSIGIDIRSNGIKLFGEAALIKKSKAVKNEGKHDQQTLSWRPSTVRNTLRNFVYIGQFKWNDTFIKNNHPPIISKDKFELTQIILDKKKTIKSSSSDYLLRGLVSCYECEGSLSQLTQKRKNKTYRYLRCSNHVRMANCYSNMQKMNYIEDDLYNFLVKIDKKIISYDDLDIKIVDDGLEEKRSNMKTKLEDFDDKFDRQMEAFQDGIITLEQLRKYKDKAKQEKVELEKEIKDLSEKMKTKRNNRNLFYKRIRKTLKLWKDDSVPLQQKKNSLKLIVEDIRVSKEKSKMKVIFKL